jgi:formamidopyrimidine-DNA glycosylase
MMRQGIPSRRVWHDGSRQEEPELPELPEVETVCRTIAPRVSGRIIREARYFSPLAADGDPDGMAAALNGRRILDVRRKGKYLIFALDTGWMRLHLRMTGKLLFDGPRTPWTRALLELDDGHTLVFDDPRQFGRLLWSSAPPEDVSRLGPDALDLGAEEFAAQFCGRSGRVKPLLLNQRVLSGLGNIYVDEALHRARIHPLTSAARLGPVRLKRLHQAVAEVLAEAIAAGGSSISDYVDAEGRRGWFQFSHRVYGREGEPCVACGAPIRRIVVGQRGTHYCPRCQRV